MSRSDRTTLAFAAATACAGNEAIRPASRSTNAVMSVGGNHPIDPAPPFGGGRIDIVTTEDHLERSTPPDQARQPDGPAAAGEDAERDFGLAEHRVRGGETHVAAQRDLAPSAADTSTDLCDRGFGHRAQLLAHRVEPVELGRQRLIGGEREDRFDVEVGDEPVGIGRTEHDGPDVVVTGEAVDGTGELDEDVEGHQVDRRMIDGDDGDAGTVDRHADGAHSSCLIAARVAAASSGFPGNSTAAKSVTPISPRRPMRSTTSSAVPVMAMSSGPAAPSRSSIAR